MSRQPINVYPARTVLARTRGLLFMTPLPPSTAMHIKPCWCVHTGLLRSPIDIVFLDAENKVLTIAESVPPWRVAAKGSERGRSPRCRQAPRSRRKVNVPALLHEHEAGQFRRNPGPCS